MITPKSSEQLQKLIDDHLDNIQAVKGAKFRDLLASMMESTQAMRMISTASNMLQETEPKFSEVLFKASAEAMASSAALLADAYGLSDDDKEEMMNWVKILDGHYETALKEANK